jgi:hypothetical protein
MSEADTTLSSGSLNRTRAFVERHDALFTVLGALIVFIGFFVKEGYQEKTRELAAKLNEASFSSAVLLRLQSLSDAFVLASPEHIKQFGALPASIDKRAAPYLGGISKQMDAITDRLAIDRNIYDGTLSLYEALYTNSTTLEEDRKHLAGEYNGVLRNTDTSENRLQALSELILQHLPQANGPLEPEVRKQIKSYSEELDKTAEGASEMEGDLYIFHDNVLETARDAAKVQEKHAKWSARLTYLLFVIGWAMGLAGKVLKLPSHGEVD